MAKPKVRIPKLRDFQSVEMVAVTGDKFNHPGLTNFLGSLQCASCVMGIQHLTFPPFSQGDIELGMLTINDVCIMTSGLPVTYRWRPDRIDRTVRVGDIDVSTTTVMGVGSQTATIRLKLANRRKKRQHLEIRVRTGGGVIQSRDGWKTPYSPKEGPAISVTPWEGAPPPESLVTNTRHVNETQKTLVYGSRTSDAYSLQGMSVIPDSIDRSWFDHALDLGPKEEATLYYFVAVGSDPVVLEDQFESWQADPSLSIAASRKDWEKEIEAVFTPGNDRYSGHLPLLDTSNKNLRRLYLNTIISVIYLKRDHPLSAYGKTYATIMPRYWVASCFINDWSMSAYLLAMLDPEVLRTTIELWLTRDIYSHFGTDYVSGTNSGNWYSCNDYAMIRLISAYVRVTGDQAWLDTQVGSRSVLQHVRTMAEHHVELTTEHGLPDFGDRNSLLEAVGAYTHEVASLSAATVWQLREVADLLEYRGELSETSRYRTMAADLVPEIQKLYIQGGGYWACRQPDGELVPVRHAWDFVHTLNFIHDDLPGNQKEEMIQFFEQELMSPSWMSALSPLDEDVGFSRRLDHEWNGSWPGWVALATSALMKNDRIDLLVRWLPGLTRSTKQGPFAQAQFIEKYADPIAGGARKGPTEWPYINDWAAMCVGGFFETIVYEMFGVEHPWSGDLMAYPHLRHFDQEASLFNVPHHGDLYDIHPKP
ncbi:MAG: hypothetical protein HKN43_13445 [Rhodothermales bacterium]|nr:hypothetical protein [Rhodothermales bacterium]